MAPHRQTGSKTVGNKVVLKALSRKAPAKSLKSKANQKKKSAPTGQRKHRWLPGSKLITIKITITIITIL